MMILKRFWSSIAQARSCWMRPFGSSAYTWVFSCPAVSDRVVSNPTTWDSDQDRLACIVAPWWARL